MGRCTVIRWAFAAGVLFCWGCSAPKSFSPFGWTQGSNSTQTSASKDPSNPLKSGDPNASSSTSSTSSSSSDTSTAATGSAASDKGAAGSGFKSANIDPALRKAMMDELQSEPADQREKLFAEWSRFDTSFIRELIETHRASRELAQSRSNLDWAGGQPAKTAANTAPGAQAPGLPGIEDPNAPSDSVLRQRTAGTTPQPPASTTVGAVSPWEDTPPTSKSPSLTRAVASTGANSLPAQPLTMSATSIAPAVTALSAATPAQKPGPFDPDIVPGNPAPSARPTVAATTPAIPTPPAVAPATPSGKSDAFADMPSIDTDPAPTSVRSQSPSATSPKMAAAPPTAAANPFADTPSNQPSVVAAPNAGGGNATAAIAAAPHGAAATVTQAGGAGPFDASGVALASATAAATNQPNGGDSEQPVKLSLPVDVPGGQVVNASDSGSTPPRAAQTSATGTPNPPPATTTSQNPPPSGLASLPGRLLGAINPLPGGANSRNISLPANWHDELQKIVSVAASEAGQTSVGTSDAEKLAYIQKQVNLRMLYLLSGQPARSLEPIAGLEPADQEFWQQVFWGMSSYFDRTTITDPRDRATQTIAQLRAAVHKLQEKSKLELRNVSFCNKIENYGRFERFKRDEFTAGQPVLLYAEVENFKSESTADGPYRAILKSTIEIFDSAGKLVQTMPFAPNEDLCASPRRDYYNSYEFAIPQQISLGPHTLKLTVEDQLSQKIASYTVNFTVK